MPTQIQKKVQQLRDKNIDLGAQLTAEIDCGYGGKLQRFSQFNIYYHPIMGTEAKEVHGAIRNKYLQLGGHEVNTTLGKRLFGFPMTDEKDSLDGRCPVSDFEWGAIYWINGGVYVHGKIYDEYKRQGKENGDLGYPLADPISLNQGSVSFFEHGCLYEGVKSNNKVISIFYTFPKLGHPWFINATEMSNKNVINFSSDLSTMNTSLAGQIFEEIFNGRIFLKETASIVEVPLAFNRNDAKVQNIGVFSLSIKNYNSVIRVSNPTLIKNNKLYDIILKLPSQKFAIAPHSVYFKESWKDFKFIHATDIHVSRRVDKFRQFFKDKSMDDAVKNLNNFNDNFRKFIRYANRMHRNGALDLIMITGDLVDYIFEDGGKNYYNNNFVFFEELVLGKTGKPDLVQSEELIVPIITSLGNHDYRKRTYYPLFTVDVQFPISNKTMEQFGSFNITKEEAEILTKEHLHIKDMVSDTSAFNMVIPDQNNENGNLNYYFRNICREASYIVNLGNHQIVMIDGKWDDGPIEGYWDAFVYRLGLKGEATDNFVDGSPDSVGFNDSELQMLSQSLQKNGLVIVGVHAPIFNVKNSEYNWFFREYIRTSNSIPYKSEMQRFLFRKDPNSFSIKTPSVSGSMFETISVDITKNKHTDWSRLHTFNFQEGMGGDLLDYGIMRGKKEDFLKICTGLKNSNRSADLILSGHVHKNWECRLMWNEQSQKYKISHDFYTENPTEYYHSYELNTDKEKFNFTGISASNERNNFIKNNTLRIHIEISETATNQEKPTKNASGVWSIKTKPYPLTLNSQNSLSNQKWWWQNIRPLFIQTAAIGPSEYLRAPEHQPDFRGCRFITVKEDTIAKIEYVMLETISKISETSLSIDLGSLGGIRR